MQSELFYNFLQTLLRDERMTESHIPKTVVNSKDFKILKSAQFIKPERATNGGTVYVVSKKEELQKYFLKHFPNPVSENKTSFQNVRTFRDTKARAKESQRIVFLRGEQTVEANQKQIQLAEFTDNFKLFSFQLHNLKAEKICFIENLDCFMVAEKIIPQEYVYMHTYGRIGKELLQKIEVKEFLFFPDYDFVGLNEYLTVKNTFPNTTLFFPKNYDLLFNKYPKALKKKNDKEQQPSQLVLQSDEAIVVKIKNQLLETKHFLEQQILFEE